MKLKNNTRGRITETCIALALFAAVAIAAALEAVADSRLAYATVFAPHWVPITTALVGAAAIIGASARPTWARVWRALQWSSLLLMLWTASGLPLDLLRLTPLMPPEVDWRGMVTRALALAAVVVLARRALAQADETENVSPASWYGYAAFTLALPYPVLRTVWAFGGTVGLDYVGAAGRGWEPWLASIPWQLAAVLSLLLVPIWRRAPRRVVLAAGWCATVIVAMIGPAAFWSVVSGLARGADLGLTGIHSWVALLFYGSWFLWAIAAAAATRSYQLRSRGQSDPPVPASA